MVDRDGQFQKVDRALVSCSVIGVVEAPVLTDRVLPLRIDLTAPPPAIGWNNEERPSFLDRLGDETVLALALIHHIAISNNTPLGHIAAWFRRFARQLIIEFVPKSDSQVQRLLRTREDVFPDYDSHHFEEEFERHFEIRERTRIRGSERDLYLMERR